MRVTPTQTSFAANGEPPGFHVETGGYRYLAVQVATHAFLLNGAAAPRRTQANFFDSSVGDDRATGRLPVRREVPGDVVAGERLEAPVGYLTYTLPQGAWERLRGADRLYYRLIVAPDEGLRHGVFSVDDVDWVRAPAVSISRVPARPSCSPVGRFRGRGVLDRPGILDQVQSQLRNPRMIQGRDGDWRYAFLDARYFDMTVLECHEWGLTDTVDKMPRKPAAIINGQFISDVFGVGTEGQVVREGSLINSNSQTRRHYVAQTWTGTDIAGYHVGAGNPATREPNARSAFGGLGPVLLGGAPVTTLTAWARSVYGRDRDVGRGVIGIHRGRGLIYLSVQRNIPFYSPTVNAQTMAAVRRRLQSLGFDAAVFNDGSDSESLYAGGGWLLTPGYAKDEAMDFAIAFADRTENRRFRTLVIDGTKTGDGSAFERGTRRPLLTHYSPRNISNDLRRQPALSSISTTFGPEIIEAWRATTQGQANLIGDVFELAGYGGHWADVLYVSSHAWRHGQLWYYRNDDHRAPKLMIADPWSPTFRPSWVSTPRWLIIAGCSVLSLRYSRGVALDATERGHLVDWHRDMYGAGATVSGLSSTKRTLLATYHPGWAWYDRVFRRSPSLRGVLGYWYRSPGGSGVDEEIMTDFSKRLREGEPILEAWETANRRAWYQAQAAWAAMVRDGCQSDTLATLEDASLPPAAGAFEYYDRFRTGELLPEAYRNANRLSRSATVGSVALRYNAEYDELAIEELKNLSVSPNPANFLVYEDGIGPVRTSL